MSQISPSDQNQIGNWKSFQKSPLWKVIQKELKKMAKDADLIVNRLGGDSEPLYSVRDIAIIKKKAYLNLARYPDEKILLLEGTQTVPTEQMDPFEEETEPPIFDDGL